VELKRPDIKARMSGKQKPANGPQARDRDGRIIVDNSNRWYDFSSSAASALCPWSADGFAEDDAIAKNMTRTEWERLSCRHLISENATPAR
jgi:hypothetical protein